MAYSEELDLIQNVKNLSLIIDNLLQQFSQVEPSMNEILELKDKFQELSDKTVGVIDEYQEKLDIKSDEIEDLLENCRSQFKQVTDDVESLVNLEVNFTSIKEEITNCLTFSNTVTDLLNGTVVYMTADTFVPVEDRVPYKRYLEVTGKVDFKDIVGHLFKISPSLGISYDAE